MTKPGIQRGVKKCRWKIYAPYARIGWRENLHGKKSYSLENGWTWPIEFDELPFKVGEFPEREITNWYFEIRTAWPHGNSEPCSLKWIRFSPCQAPGFAWPSRTVLGEPCEKIFWGMWSEETSLTDPVFELNVVFLTKGFHKTRHADSADFSHLWLTYINIHHLKCHHDTLKLGVSTTGLERSPLSPRWM